MKHTQRNNLNGWLVIDKPEGLSSNAVVGKVKRLTGGKVGHAGTLDPLASGILPIAIGEATKLTSYLMDAKKKYFFKLKFGNSTTTGDREGEILETTNFIPDAHLLKSTLQKFIGEIDQVPHRFSALKVDGKRAYDLARAGEEFELKSRKITIYSLDLLNFDEEKGVADIEATCSKGTYIRSLGEDIAKDLKSFGFLLELRRLQVGKFDTNNSIELNKLTSLENITDLFALKEFQDSFFACSYMLDDIPAISIDGTIVQKLRFGQTVRLNQDDLPLVWLKHDEELVAIGAIVQGQFINNRVFNL